MSKFQKNLKIEPRVHPPPPQKKKKKKTLAIVQEYRTKSAIKLSIKVLLYLISEIDLNIPCEGFTKICSYYGQSNAHIPLSHHNPTERKTNQQEDG